MNIGLIGLGRMGQAVAARLIHGGYHVYGYDVQVPERLDLSLGHDQIDDDVKARFILAQSFEAVAKNVEAVWLFVPAGAVVDTVINELVKYLPQGKIIIDGGNSFFKHSVERYHRLKKLGFHFIDCGTSGGLHGRMQGFSLMIGGDAPDFELLKSMFESVAAPGGFGLVGPAGAGHYVKMIHNGIEYGILEAYAEGFHLMKEGQYKQLNLAQISSIWDSGSIIRSWILTLTHDIMVKDQNFEEIYGAIDEHGTGRWTVDEAAQQNIPMPVIRESLLVRDRSRKTGGNYATKLVALLRQAFGGHPVSYVFKTSNKKDQKF